MEDAWLQKAKPRQDWNLLRPGRCLDNLGIELHRFTKALEDLHGGYTKESVLRCLLRCYVAQVDAPEARVVVVKRGAHAKIWREIVTAIPNVKFLFIHRDPRAVISSKLLTKRPYYPLESMAPRGVLAAALRWRHFCREVNKAATVAPVHILCYEDLIGDSAREMAQIAAFFAVRTHNAAGRQYTIPEAERGIHRLVQASGHQSARVSAWRAEIASWRIAVIEAASGEEMRAKGYAAKPQNNHLEPTIWVAIGLLDGAIRSPAHYFYVAMVNAWRVVKRTSAHRFQK